MTNLRKQISQILIKWGMPTRQAAIIEIENLLRGQLSEIVEKLEEKSVYSSGRIPNEKFSIDLDDAIALIKEII